MAAYVICALAEQPELMRPCAVDRLSNEVRHRLYQRCLTRERKRLGLAAPTRHAPCPIPLSSLDAEFVACEVFRGKSPLSGTKMGAGAQLVLTRWDGRRAADVDNLVLLTKDEAAEHDAACASAPDGDGRAALPPAVVARVDALIRDAVTGCRSR